MFTAKKPVYAKQVNINYVKPQPVTKKQLLKVFDIQKEAIFVFNPKTIEIVVKKLLLDLWPDASKTEKAHFYNIIYALLKSIRRDALVLYQKEPETIELFVNTYFESLCVLEPAAEFNSPLFHKQIKAKYDFYEKAYDYRSIIHNYDWSFKYLIKNDDGTYKEYKYLDEDLPLFIKLREKYKMYHEDIKCFKDPSTAPLCQVCQKPCATRPKQVCTFCYQFDKLELFIKICTKCHLMGSFFMFYFYLPEVTFYYMFENKDKIMKIFSEGIRPISATPLELYYSAEEMKKYITVKDVFKEESKKLNGEDDGMMKLIQQLNDEQEELVKKERKNLLNKFYKEINETKREVRRKRKEREAKKKKEEEELGVEITIAEPNKLKADTDGERTGYLKSLADYFDPEKSYGDMGDKSLDDCL